MTTAHHQEIVWIEPDPTRPHGGLGKLTYGHPERIVHVWTLFHRGEEPALPIVPQHHVNAFLEAKIHDWRVVGGDTLRYYSRVADHSCWVLVEYHDRAV